MKKLIRLLVLVVLPILVSPRVNASQTRSRGGEQLLEAVKFGMKDKVSVLLDQDLDQRHLNNALAAASGVPTFNESIVKGLLGAGADINALGSGDVTPLMVAVQRGNIDMVRFLLNQKNIDAFKRNESGKNAYDLVSSSVPSSAEMRKMLEFAALTPGEKRNFSVALFSNISDRRVNTPLSHIKNLIEGADLNYQEFYTGKTLLMHAVESDKADIVKALLEAGADPLQTDRYGRNAFDKVLPGSNEIKRMLEEKDVISEEERKEAKKAVEEGYGLRDETGDKGKVPGFEVLGDLAGEIADYL